MSYLKTQNSIYNKLLTRTYLQTLFSIYDQQFLSFLKKKTVLFNRMHKIVIQMYRCTTHTKNEKKEKKRKSKKYYKIKSTGDELNVGYDKVNFPVGV